MNRDTYIIHKSGICLLSPYLHRKSTDIELLNEILAALAQFTKHMICEEITEVKLGKHNINYYTKDEITLAIVTSSIRRSKHEQTSLTKKLSKFTTDRFQEYLNQKIIQPVFFQSFDYLIHKIITTDARMEPFLILSFTPTIEKE